MHPIPQLSPTAIIVRHAFPFEAGRIQDLYGLLVSNPGVQVRPEAIAALSTDKAALFVCVANSIVVASSPKLTTMILVTGPSLQRSSKPKRPFKLWARFGIRFVSSQHDKRLERVCRACLALAHPQSPRWQHALQDTVFQNPVVPCRCDRMNTGKGEQQVCDPSVQFNRIVPERLVAWIKGWHSEPGKNRVATNPDTAQPDHDDGDQQCIEQMVHTGRRAPQYAGIRRWQLDAARLTPDEPQQKDKRQCRTDRNVQAANGQPRCAAREEPDALADHPKADHQGST